MSAYICDKAHIVYLVSAAMSCRLNRAGGGFSWYFGNPSKRGELMCADYEVAAEVGSMLWRENIKSVSHRYPNKSSAELPGPIGETFEITDRDFKAYAPEPEPVQVLKACDCLAYQSCEHPEWEASEAFAFIARLRQAAIGALPGYDNASWGAPEKQKAGAL